MKIYFPAVYSLSVNYSPIKTNKQKPEIVILYTIFISILSTLSGILNCFTYLFALLTNIKVLSKLISPDKHCLCFTLHFEYFLIQVLPENSLSC